MRNHSLQLASAIVLGDSAVEMLLDAAAVLKDAGETTERQALSSIADQASGSLDRLRRRKLLLETDGAPEAANENEATGATYPDV
jgi:hypothetical protein